MEKEGRGLIWRTNKFNRSWKGRSRQGDQHEQGRTQHQHVFESKQGVRTGGCRPVCGLVGGEGRGGSAGGGGEAGQGLKRRLW